MERVRYFLAHVKQACVWSLRRSMHVTHDEVEAARTIVELDEEVIVTSRRFVFDYTYVREVVISPSSRVRLHQQFANCVSNSSLL